MNNLLSIFNQQRNWFGYANQYDCIFGDDLKDDGRREIRNNFGVPNEEIILFCRDTSFWNNKDQGCVFTQRGIYVLPDNDNPNDEFVIEWKEFDNVHYQDLIFYFTFQGNSVAHLHYNNIIKCDNTQISSVANSICLFLNKVASQFEADPDPYQLAEEGKYDEAIKVAEEQLVDTCESIFTVGRMIYLQQANQEEVDEEALRLAIAYFEDALNQTDDPESWNTIYRNIAFVHNLSGNNWGERYAYMRALEFSNNKSKELGEIAEVENRMSDVWEHYTEIFNLDDRKFCMPIKDNEIGGCLTQNIDVFRQSNIPSCFQFPFGHPYPNQLYIAHPYKTSLYVPFEESEDIFFLDKVQELCYILECLGAESIEILSIKGKTASEIASHASDINANADVKLFSGNAGQSSSGKHANTSESKTSRAYTIRMDPMKKPYLPENLIWYEHQPQWRRLVERRLNNNLLEYSESVQSSDSRFTSNTEVNDIKGEASYLWTKVGANVHQYSEAQFKTSSETIWEIKVKFKSVKDLCGDKVEEHDTNEGSGSLSDNEKSYIEEYQFCIEEDGELTSKELKMLDRLRIKLGISELRAAELISLVSPQYTEEEKEFIEEIKACLEDDGVITSREIKMLDRMSTRLGISDTRAKEILSKYIER